MSAGDALLRTASQITVSLGNGSGVELLPLSWLWERSGLVCPPESHLCTETLTCTGGKLLRPTLMLVGGKKTVLGTPPQMTFTQKPSLPRRATVNKDSDRSLAEPQRLHRRWTSLRPSVPQPWVHLSLFVLIRQGKLCSDRPNQPKEPESTIPQPCRNLSSRPLISHQAKRPGDHGYDLVVRGAAGIIYTRFVRDGVRTPRSPLPNCRRSSVVYVV